MQSFQTIIKPTRDNHPYKLRCRFKIEPYPRIERLNREKFRAAEMFVSDMRKQRWVYDERFGFRMTGPYPFVAPVVLPKPRLLRARDMVSAVARGERFLDSGITGVSEVPELSCTEWWEYELEGVFVRPRLMIEVPDLHEER